MHPFQPFGRIVDPPLFSRFEQQPFQLLAGLQIKPVRLPGGIFFSYKAHRGHQYLLRLVACPFPCRD
jgi:hypothetical protein